MHRARVVIIAGAAVAAASLPFTYVALPLAGNVNGLDGNAWPGVVLLAFPAVLALWGDRAEGFGAPTGIVAVTATAGAVVFAAFKVADASRAVDEAGGGSIGSGPWLLLGGCVLALAGAVYSLSRRLG